MLGTLVDNIDAMVNKRIEISTLTAFHSTIRSKEKQMGNHPRFKSTAREKVKGGMG